ncbi:MAG: efflux RND transporter periplasmic adaptor subunit [Ignavibacteriae bacterium]|nr:efflux RND transporter periplasmic adaptor subunit [Ignavibacteriota bacterium]
MNRTHILLSILIIAALSVFIVACGESDAKTSAEQQEQQQAQATAVQVKEIQTEAFTEVLQTAGIVKAVEDVMLSPEEGGVIKKWRVEKGQRVAKGDVLAVLKDDVLQASYDAAHAQYKLAELNFEKQQAIYNEQAISEMQLKNSEYNRDAAKAQADLMKARLERAYLRSPIDGTLNDRFADDGEFAPPGVPVAHVVNLSTVKILAEIPEREAGSVSMGATARVVVEAIGGDTLAGKVSFVGSAVSPNNRTLPVEIVINNPGMQLKPEMVAKVHIVRSRRSGAILISDHIVQQVDRNKLVVFVVKNGRAEERVVKLGSRSGSRVEVLEGLNPGDRVIIEGFQKLVNGQLIQAQG